jgi:hypothetical protein
MSTAAIVARIARNATTDTNLLAIAEGCRAANLTALACAPELYLLFPTTSASDMAAALVRVWACELSLANLTAALASCLQANGNAAYTAAQSATATAASMSLKYLDGAHVPTQYGGAPNGELKMIGLSQGDLTAIRPAEAARFLIISCLPGDYSPSSQSLIAAVNNAYGIQVATLAQNPAADYRATYHCWISQNLSTYTTKKVPYQQLICFESTGAAAPSNIPGIFSAIKSYIPAPPPIPNTGPTIVSALVSTGGAGGNPSAVLTALFNGCWGLMTAGAGYNITCFRVDIFPTSWEQQLTALFEQLKQSHQ